MCKKVVLLLLILISFKAQAQIPYIDSKEYILEGVELHKNGSYKKAIEKFKQVHECDTNYATALYEEILSLTADSSFATAKALALSGLRLPLADKRDFLLSLAAIYDYMDQSDSALIIYDSLIKMSPNDHQPWYEKGVVYFRKKLYDQATYHFQHSLMIMPTHFGSHYLLGMVYTMQGRLSEAMIAMQTSLLMTQSADYAKKSITIVSSITSETDEVVKLYHSKAEQYSHPLFDEIDQLVNSKLALNSNYKLKINLNDDIFRQTQVIMEKLEYDPKDTNFVMQFYVPLLSQIFKDDMFEPYMLLLYSGYGFTNVDALAKRNSKKMDEARSVVFPYLNKLQTTRELNYSKREKAAELYHYYPKDNLIIIGSSIKRDKEELVVGDIKIYRGNHTLRTVGHYDNNGEKDAVWTEYYSTGVIKSKDYYAHNKKRDTSFSYYGNGNTRMISILDKDGNATTEYEYVYFGWMSLIRKKLSEERIEVREYHPNGQLELIEIIDGNTFADGKYTVYFANGKVKKEFSYKKGKYDGLYKFYYENGQLSEEARYENGSLEGPYMAYYDNGKVKEKSAYENGKEDGAFEKYDEDGKLTNKGMYHKGQITDVNMFSPTGRLYGIMNLSDNVPYKIKFTDEDNKMVFFRENNKGIYQYQLYYPNGNKSADIKIDDKGLREGNLAFYNFTGAKNEESVYKAGNAEGKSKGFYSDGKVRIDQSYVNDNRDGYYKSYYHNGNVMQEGWYKQGKQQGLWKTYYVNGKLESEKYLLNDKVEGFYKEYNINGELTNKYIYDYGSPVSHTTYDTAGNKVDSIHYTTAYNSYKLNYHQNNTAAPDLEYNIKYGNTEGLCISHYVNGNIQEQKYFKEGHKDSIYYSYYPDGKIRSKGIFKKGYRTGKWEFYNELGDVVKEDNYNANGDQDGKCKTFANKTVYIAYNYKNGNKDGEQIYYGENNKPAFILIYDDGTLVGYTHEGKDGKMLPAIKVKNGTVKFTALYANGQKAGEVDIQENIIRGKLVVYYSNGNIAEERNYKFFDLDGPFKRYTPDGKLIYECMYVDDEESGVEHTYDDSGAPVIEASYYLGTVHGPTTIIDPATHNTRTYNYHYGHMTTTTK